MLHGPHSQNSPFLKKDAKSFKNFPKVFCSQTIFEKNRYPKYKQTGNSSSNFSYFRKTYTQSIPVDNSMVVPYNRFLLRKYRYHINVEYCASTETLKYIFRYLHKGCDRAFCQIKSVKDNEQPQIIDEISNYIDGRYVGPMEAAWRLQSFPLCGSGYKVVRLAVHTEDKKKYNFSS